MKEISITISKDSSDEEILKYLKNELNISDDSIENLGLDTEISESLFGNELITEKEIRTSLTKKEIKQEEYDILKKFIEKRDEMLKKQKSISLSRESTKEDIIKYLKEKFNFDINKQDIKDLNLDEYENITKEEKDILENFIKEKIRQQKKPTINVNDNIIHTEMEIDNDVFEVYQKVEDKNIKDNHKKKKYEIKMESFIYYSKIEKKSFQIDANYNIFFILSLNNKSIFNLEFAAFQKKRNYFNTFYINYNMNLINISEYNSKGETY